MVNKVIISLPAYNEESYIGSLVLKCKQYGEVLVCNDGSKDRTAEIARLAGANVISHEKNLGYGATIKTIMSEALKQNADILVILDSDDQHDTKDISNMIKAITDGNDLAIGNRNLKQMPKFRIVGQKILSYFTDKISGSKVSDSQSGFRAFSKKALQTLKLKEDGMAIVSEQISEATKAGLKIVEVPISVKYTKDGHTFNPIIQASNSLTRIFVLIAKQKPLMFFGIAGLIMTVLGLLAGIGGYNSFMRHEVLPVGTLLIAVMLLIIGILCIFTGIILNAVKRE
jgi:glycosyltransferase involved in cell wall biosynthesis